MQGQNRRLYLHNLCQNAKEKAIFVLYSNIKLIQERISVDATTYHMSYPEIVLSHDGKKKEENQEKNGKHNKQMRFSPETEGRK